MNGMERRLRAVEDRAIAVIDRGSANGSSIRGARLPVGVRVQVTVNEVIGAGDVVPAKKPAPDIYHWVLERLDLAPDACLALEDSENGLAASLGAGIPTLVTENAYTRGQNFTGALAVLPDLGAINLTEIRKYINNQLPNK